MTKILVKTSKLKRTGNVGTIKYMTLYMELTGNPCRPFFISNVGISSLYTVHLPTFTKFNALIDPDKRFRHLNTKINAGYYHQYNFSDFDGIEIGRTFPIKQTDIDRVRHEGTPYFANTCGIITYFVARSMLTADFDGDTLWDMYNEEC